jgi:hypothetical protein
VYRFRICLTGETSKKGRTSGGLPYRVNRGLILCEIKIGQSAKADGTHVGRHRGLLGAATGCRGLLSKWSTKRALHSRCHRMSRELGPFDSPLCI